MVFDRRDFEMSMKDRHGMIQAIAKEKRQSCLVTGFKRGNKVIAGPELNRYLFNHTRRKFNPGNRNYKIIESDGTTAKFQEFKHVMSYMTDKKAHKVDGMSVLYLKRLGLQPAFRFFSKWLTK